MNQDLLYKYFKGNATDEEEKQLLDWIDKSEENQESFQKERMLYDIALFTDKKQTNSQRNIRSSILPVLKMV